MSDVLRSSRAGKQRLRGGRDGARSPKETIFHLQPQLCPPPSVLKPQGMRGACLRAPHLGRVGFACRVFFWVCFILGTELHRKRFGTHRYDQVRGTQPCPPLTWGCPSCSPECLYLLLLGDSRHPQPSEAAPSHNQPLAATRTNWETPARSEPINVPLWCASGAGAVPKPGTVPAAGAGSRQDAGCCADESTDSLCLFCLVTALDFNV